MILSSSRGLLGWGSSVQRFSDGRRARAEGGVPKTTNKKRQNQESRGQQTVAWNRASRDRARNSPSVRLSTNKHASFATRRRKMRRQRSAGPRRTMEKIGMGMGGAQVAVRRLAPLRASSLLWVWA